MSTKKLEKVAGIFCLFLAAACPLIFTGLYHYAFKHFDETGGMATFFTGAFSMLLMLACGATLLKIELPQ